MGLHFGIPLHSRPVTIVEHTRVPLEPGTIVLLIGPSGSGKSSALGEIQRQRPGGCVVNRVTFPAETAIIDRVAPWGNVKDAMAILTACGLGEPRLWVRRFSEMSDGEKFRARLAVAVALQTRSVPAGPLCCDEFCTGLHRRAAKAISHNLHKLVKRRNLLAALACSNEDVVADLRPDVLVRLKGNCRCDVTRADVRTKRSLSLIRRLRIERGSKSDYEDFATMHYRTTDELGFVDRVFVLCDRTGDETLGIVVYAHSPMELRLRNEATGRRYSGNPTLLNRELRILRRLVIHPDVRGCGLGHYLVQKTLPMVGTKYVECLAVMGEFNPVFERAGMERIGQCAIPPRSQAALDALRAMDVDPNGRDFPMQVCRRRRVREIITRVVYDWYRGTTGAGRLRVERQAPETLAHTFRGLIGSRPVYYLWKRRRAA